ncbi:MAG: hypothetical protein MI810_10805 [Flavobacteriales bacterium]|nr:hypothetical protein [Flavobacteriales bacterium]
MAEISNLKLYDQSIQISNSFFGMESIKVNGKALSKKWAPGGADHEFVINNLHFKIHLNLKNPKKDKSTISVFKNDQLIHQENIQLKAIALNRFLIGIAIGILVYYVLNHWVF